jgi:hypothetical protein
MQELATVDRQWLLADFNRLYSLGINIVYANYTIIDSLA